MSSSFIPGNSCSIIHCKSSLRRVSCRSQSFDSTSQAFEHQSRIGGGDDPWPHLVSAKPTCPLSLEMACCKTAQRLRSAQIHRFLILNCNDSVGQVLLCGYVDIEVTVHWYMPRFCVPRSWRILDLPPSMNSPAHDRGTT